MSRKVAFRQTDTERAIRAAERVGLKVVAIRPDGTIITMRPGEPSPLSPIEAPVAPERKIVLL